MRTIVTHLFAVNTHTHTKLHREGKIQRGPFGECLLVLRLMYGRSNQSLLHTRENPSPGFILHTHQKEKKWFKVPATFVHTGYLWNSVCISLVIIYLACLSSSCSTILLHMELLIHANVLRTHTHTFFTLCIEPGFFIHQCIQSHISFIKLCLIVVVGFFVIDVKK